MNNLISTLQITLCWFKIIDKIVHFLSNKHLDIHIKRVNSITSLTFADISFAESTDRKERMKQTEN